ncbi:HDIG domain-containing protein [Paenibacillus psychroresistens]|uniref:HDIG domain-containing protein n=1 Tax=Paenibacillus psychroresistens TaxID=1778678 RepID=A0A6B8RJZ3_9BACL|nr:HDIG domain-containing metalloprotein [Paenibacillus psychroresistens]QGQ95726.1 HDIG domain-containing protein [Paenibacillus psychroresistens]
MTQNEVSMGSKVNEWLTGWKSNLFVRLFLFFLLILLFYFSLSTKLVPKTYDIEPNTYSEKTILATKQIENVLATKEAKLEAAQKVQPIYQIISFKSEQLIDILFDKLLQNNASADTVLNFEEKVSLYNRVIPETMLDYVDAFVAGLEKNPQYSTQLVQEIKLKLLDQQYKIPAETYYKLPRLSESELNNMEPIVKSIVSKLMSDPIIEVQGTRNKVTEQVNSSDLSTSVLREVAQDLVRFSLTANKYLDEQGTAEARDKAQELTKTIFINKNDAIINKDQLITNEIYEQLKSMNLLTDKASYLPRLGLLLLSSLLVLVLYLFIRQSKLSIRENNSQLLMLVIIYIVNIAVMHIVELGVNLDFPYIGFITPVALGTVLIMILLEAPLAWVSTLIFAITASIIFNNESAQLFDFRYGFVAVVVGYASVFSLNQTSQRISILRAGIINSAFSVLSVVILLLLDNHYTIKETTFALSFAATGGVLTAVLVIGILPFFEAVFGILSPLKLIELSHPNLPLLRKLLTETPGTYHHSIMVGNLSEAAADSIGADGLLCRVGSYYHDIGKTRRPSYFIENQSNMENPHDSIEPSLSKSIIMAHTREGVEMLKEHKIPKAIRDIAEQHHGTTLLKYFHHKALQKLGDSGSQLAISEEEYRYPGPKAQSKEAAIVGIADCVEAAVRSMRSPTMEQIDTMVEKIIKQRLEDGQFNECDLTLKELTTISKALREALLGIFHSRIEYPSDLKE